MLFVINSIKFQWSKDKQNRIKPSGAGKARRKSHKPNKTLRPMERGQHRYNHENESVSADNPNPSLSDVPVHQVQKRISRQDETIFVAPSNIQHRRPSHKSHQQRRSSRKSEVLFRKKHLNLSNKINPMSR